MALGVAALFILIVGFPRLRTLARIALIGILAVLAAYLVGMIPARLLEPILMKLGVIDISFTSPSNDNYANSERVAHWLAGINMFQDHPFFGVGIGNYQDAYSQYHIGMFVLPLAHAHNYYIFLAADAGILGLTALLLFLLTRILVGSLRVAVADDRAVK